MLKRVDIKTGYLCNNNCRFCVQAHNKQFANKNAEEIKESLRNSLADGCNAVVFTGGEFTLREDCLILVKYARDIGYNAVQIQTNGRMFADMDFCKKMINAGANEFSPALHGPTAEIHDYLTRAPGSFENTTRGMRNLVALGQKLVCNSVIVKANYRHAPETASLFADLKVHQFQFAFVHAMGNALEDIENIMPRKSLVAPYLKKAIDVAMRRGIPVTVEAIPFCLMVGYEKHISELYIPMTRVEERNRVILDFKKLKLKDSKVKFEQCKVCRFEPVCEGPWKEYPDLYGSDEFQPIRGFTITDPKDIINDKL